jgi:RND family efflux transporter MFP subunit
MKKITNISILCLLLTNNLLAENYITNGTIISDNEKILSSRYMGFITKVNIHEGDIVKKGEILYKIDSKEIDNNLKQVKLMVSQAKLSMQMYKNQYNNLKLNLERNKRLLKQDFVSKYEVENLELAEKNLLNMIDISKKQVEQAQIQVETVLNQYKYLNIIAPNDGVIIKKNIKVGEIAIPGIPSIILSDLNDLKIISEIPESNFKYINIGKKVDINIESLNLKLKGKIEAIIPNLNQMTHSLKIKISFDKKNNNIYPGMYTSIEINKDEKINLKENKNDEK